MGNQMILEMMVERTPVKEEVKLEKVELLSSGKFEMIETVHAFEFAWNIINKMAYSVNDAIEAAKRFFKNAVFADVKRLLNLALS